MKLLDQFISRTGRQPADWTSQDIQRYLNYRSALVAEGTGPKKNEQLLQKTDFRHPVESLRALRKAKAIPANWRHGIFRSAHSDALTL
jgi:hypothetical protein